MMNQGTLPIHLNHHPGSENHLEPVIMNRDLDDKPPDPASRHIPDDRRMLLEGNAHFGVPLAQVIPVDVFHLSFLPFIAPAADLFRHLINFGMGAG